jgi:hypothetical protein
MPAFEQKYGKNMVEMRKVTKGSELLKIVMIGVLGSCYYKLGAVPCFE